MKKLISIILALSLALCMSTSVLAAKGTKPHIELSFTYEVLESMPTYTVTITASLDLSLSYSGNYFTIETSDATNLDGQKIIVTFEGTQDSLDRKNLVNTSNSLDYVDYDMINITSETKILSVGSTVAEFVTNGIQTVQFIITTPAAVITPNSPYTGWIIFGIKLE